MANVSLVDPFSIFAVQAEITEAITAGELICSIREYIPDPTINPLTGEQEVPCNPDHDGGLLSAATLYQWLTDGMRDMTRRSHWVVEDWWAFAAIENQPIYRLDSRWHQVEGAYAYQRQCWPYPETQIVYPAQATGTPLLYGSHARVGALEVFFWPNPNLADPVTRLTADVGPRDTVFPVVSTDNFQESFGWIRVDGELCQYNMTDSTTLSIARRGCSGTLPAIHMANAEVYSLALWVKGVRTPTKVVSSLSRVEIPEAFLVPLLTYVRAQVKGKEQDEAGEQQLMNRYREEIQSIINDPIWQSDPRDGQAQVRAYGHQPGGIAPIGPFGTIIQ